jgi:hypothetical protein
MPGAQVTYTATIDVDPNTRVGLTDGDRIVVEGLTDGFACARVTVRDPDGLAQAIARMAELRTPIDAPMRRAIFAALRAYHGRELDRTERLQRLSELAEREVRTINSLTRVEGGRILDRLARRTPGPADADADGSDGGWHEDGDPD